MIEMTDQEFRLYMRQLLRAWEHSNGRIHAPSDVVYLIAFVDDYYQSIYLESKNDLID